KVRTVEEILTIEIKPGWKKGTKLTFPEKGNQEPGVIAADLIFVVDEKLHEVFTREGNDLVVNQEISLVDALTGKTIELTSLDGRNLLIPVTEMVKPGYELTVPNEGMPISKDPRKKGNLRIKFDVSKVRTVEEILTIEIKPGWKKGTKLTFPEKGNQEPGVIAADLIFVVDEKLHEVFTREGLPAEQNSELRREEFGLEADNL
ncbi:DnaJ homolog subfamily B member 1, partial [Tanacetum coccineum]